MAGGEEGEEPAREFDALAGGYPVPPKGEQVLPEFATVLSEEEPPARTDDDPDGLGAKLGAHWMGIFDPVAGFGVTFRTMFRKTFTIDYPNGPRQTAPRFHGRHQLNRWPDGLEKCVGCELCAWACPAGRDLRRGRAEHRGGAVLAG